MPKYVAMLRGVNVGARNRMKMPDLQALVIALGHANVVTYIQSGNVVFDSRVRNSSALADGLAQGISEQLGLEVGVLLRSREELAKIARANPYLRTGADETKLHVTFLAETPEAERVRSLAGFDAGADEMAVRGREVYLHCPGGYGTTKLSNGFLERRLAVTATTRNWNTVMKLLQLAGGA
jgi:uncharacterized protein (DUF1697 family)